VVTACALESGRALEEGPGPAEETEEGQAGEEARGRSRHRHHPSAA